MVGVCAGSSGSFERIALPALQRLTEVHHVVVRRDQHCIATAYNSILDEVSETPGLDGVLLIHDDVELRDPEVFTKLRHRFADPVVGLVGVIGARRVKSLRWWDWDKRGRVSETRGVLDFGRFDDEVDCVDGLFLAIAPAVARTVRFDDVTFPRFDGYDVDYGFQVRRAGYTVRLVEVDLHHHTKATFADEVEFERALRAFSGKWGLTVTPWDRVRRRAAQVRSTMWSRRGARSVGTRVSR